MSDSQEVETMPTLIDLVYISYRGRESKPRNSDFTKTTLCQRGNTKCMAQISVALDQLENNHASKYRIYEKVHYFGAHFTEIQGFAMKQMLKMS